MTLTEIKPVIVYIDDEPKNLSLFELILGELFVVKMFDNAVEALKILKSLDPWVIVSDQRMPSMTGLEFLELANQLLPNVPRIILTGQTNEDTIVKLVRNAKIFDYITKPVLEDDVINSIEKAVTFSRQQREIKAILADKQELTQSLEKKALELEKQNNELLNSRANETALRREAEAWASSEIIEAMMSHNLKFPLRRDIVCITYDIVNSSNYHDQEIDGIDIRGLILTLFTKALLKYGGVPECHGGDAAFGHFGAFSKFDKSFNAALAVAQDFRVALRNLERIHQVNVECGIAMHLAKQAIIQVHEIQVEALGNQKVKKFLSSASREIDLLFRIEKLTHLLPGSNIIMTKEIFEKLNEKQNIVSLGQAKNLKGQNQVIECYLIPSSLVNAEQLNKFIEEYFGKNIDVIKTGVVA